MEIVSQADTYALVPVDRARSRNLTLLALARGGIEELIQAQKAALEN